MKIDIKQFTLTLFVLLIVFPFAVLELFIKIFRRNKNEVVK